MRRGYKDTERERMKPILEAEGLERLNRRVCSIGKYFRIRESFLSHLRK